ncbi:polysaccharide deacetylase family protein [Phycisphaera mikurensis]|uniref:Putative hydrolase n=1 Tax=Phycisphaera mikurensis (strain NBRC 102666 / KCTC 22515 / FYK2301M01) TaxID=1142394 RepID=I0IBT4_PHYMF|nr:polysaccharide deacetylase family protein [Phycisphaera mikurensis]MBB6442049.1 peptidoglycan/xylan/chitin deacetylase (PgdA/CDA1 family) [Phycisphaera mikurensis]BAM02722.1 putative hydrolase [Phycisphaera mikurensis NBRC 102666]
MSGVLVAAGAAGLAASAAGIARGIASPRSSLLMPVRWRADPAACGPVAALTFDDGPHPVGTPLVLEALARRGVRATFFVIGQHVERHPELVREIRDAGHLIGNHSHRHGHADALRGRRFWRRELGRCGDAVEAACGVRPTLFRPPMGVKSPLQAAAVRDLGLAAVTWSRRGRDGRRADPQRILDRLGDAGPGEILTLHDGTDPAFDRDPRPTAAALDPLLHRLLGGGRIERLVGVDELLGLAGTS